jgi:two-component system, NtrC family, sensor kinase
MHTVLFGRDVQRARNLAAPLCREGYQPELLTLDEREVVDADIKATEISTIVFIDLAIGVPRIVVLCRRIRERARLVPPLLAILGEPSDHDADSLIAGGANMYFANPHESLALRTRFLRTAFEGRARFEKSLTDLAAALERNRELELQHRELLAKAPTPVFVHRDGRMLWANTHAAELLGIAAPAEAIGLPIIEFVPQALRTQVASTLRQADHGEFHDPVEATILKRDGTPGQVWVVSMPTMFDGAQATIAFMRDLTAQRRLESQLIASERLVSLGRLAASVGHEINNPLMYVLENLERATRELRSGRQGPEVVALLEAALSGAHRVKRSADDLRAFTDSASDRLVPVDIRAVIDSCVRMTHGELRHRAKIVQLLEDVPEVLANPPQLTHVITNLLLNAACSLGEGAASKNTVTITLRLSGEMVELRVDDTGDGIAPDDLPHVFEPFSMAGTERAGTGLGLSVCKTLVAAQNGTLSIESELGKGTCLTLEIPVAVVERPKVDSVRERLPLVARRVLLIDDEALLASILRLALKPHDMTS